MAANGYHTPLQDLGRSLVAELKSLTVAQLKDLLRRQGLTVSGVKSELQIRAIASKYIALPSWLKLGAAAERTV